MTPSSIEEASIIVLVDPDIEDLIPGFLQNREKDIRNITEALESGDWETVRLLGHSMKGSGAGYGFDGISDIGALIEGAAKDQDAAAVRTELGTLQDYLARVEVRYE